MNLTLKIYQEYYSKLKIRIPLPILGMIKRFSFNRELEQYLHINNKIFLVKTIYIGLALVFHQCYGTAKRLRKHLQKTYKMAC